MSRNWEKTLISATTTIKQALEIINNEALHVALVVNEDKKLLGVITDGDIRRSLLRGLSLSDSAKLVMNNEPITAEIGTEKEHLITIMKKKSIMAIPLINEERTVVGLETLHSALEQKKYDNPIFIMAGGFGTRLRPLTDTCPKPMLKIGDKPILEIIIKNFINSGFYNFFISLHFMPEIIRDYFGDGSKFGINITYIYEAEPLGTAGALSLLPKDTLGDSPMIIMNADLLTNMNFDQLLQFHEKTSSDATVCVREYEYRIPYGVIQGDGSVITGIDEKPVQRYFVNAGIYVLSTKIIREMKENTRIDMPTLLEMHFKNNNVHMFPIHEYWLDIGKFDDFQRAQSDIHSLGMFI